jgi:ComF family protein
MLSRSQPLTLDDDAYRDNWLNSAQRLISSIARHSSVCRLCGARTDRVEICVACKNDLPWREAPWRKRLSYIDGVSVGFHFEYPIRQLIHRAKYGRDIACARFLGELFAERLALNLCVPKSAALFPVPLARGRMLVRGFNQAVEIALPIKRCQHLPINVVSVYKPKARLAQSTLNAMKRRTNIRGAFKHRDQLQVETAVIVDDVLTTGATVSAMARALKKAGAKTVLAWVVAAA